MRDECVYRQHMPTHHTLKGVQDQTVDFVDKNESLTHSFKVSNIELRLSNVGKHTLWFETTSDYPWLRHYFPYEPQNKYTVELHIANVTLTEAGKHFVEEFVDIIQSLFSNDLKSDRDHVAMIKTDDFELKFKLFHFNDTIEKQLKARFTELTVD